MCGIVGFIQKALPESAARESLSHMMAAVRHRGPDESGQYVAQHDGWTIALGHQRLSIIDVAGGKQPFAALEGQVVLTYNGEVYNFQQLRPRTSSDTEVVATELASKGLSAVPSFNGMFAFGVWDARVNSLTLARDRAGVKPLYYAPLEKGGIAFASELTALLKHPLLGRTISSEGLASYLFGDYAHPPATLIEGVYKLTPGHHVTWLKGSCGEQKSYWSAAAIETRDPGQSDEVLVKKLWELADQAVRRQLVADVPVGVFLSGGIDSSVIATLARMHVTGPLQTFSIGFEEADYDESRFARLVAKKLKTNHVEKILSERVLLDTLDRALDCLDEPMADPSIVPTFLLSELASKHVKVALGGDGGDELFGGYPTYRAHQIARFYSLVPRVMREQIFERVAGSLSSGDGYQSLGWKAKRFTERWDDNQLARHLRWMSSTDLGDLKKLVGAREAQPVQMALAAGKSASDPLNEMMKLDFQTYLPGSVLAKVDRASMAHSLETRPPLLDNELVDWALALPSRYKVRGSESKYLFKQAAREHVPPEILDRKKRGFAIPLAKWLRGPLSDRLARVMTESPLWDSGLLDRDQVLRWKGEHQASRGDWAKSLWTILVLDHWARRIGARI